MSEDNASKKNNYALLHLKQFSYFDSIQEMDYIVKTYNKELKKSVYETLNLIKQYSCKCVGVAHLKTQTIAKRLKRSVSTIRRHVRVLKNNGMLTVITTIRSKSGGYGANGFAINSPVERKRVLKSKNEHSEMNTREGAKNSSLSLGVTDSRKVLVPKHTINSLKLFNSLKLQRESEKQLHNQNTENIKNYEECPNNIPNEIYTMYKAYFSTRTLEKLNECVNETLCAFDIENNDKLSLAIQSFKSLIHSLKDTIRFDDNKIKNIFKYIKGIVRNKARYHIDKVNKDEIIEEKRELQSREMTPKWLQDKTGYTINKTQNNKQLPNREMTPKWLEQRYKSNESEEEDQNLAADREAFLKKLRANKV